MINQLRPLLDKGYALQMLVSAVDGQPGIVDLSIVASTSGTLPAIPAKSFVGPAEEIDAQLSTLLNEFAGIQSTLSEQLADLKLVADAVAAEATKKAAEKPKVIKTVKPSAKSVVPSGLRDDDDDGDSAGDGGVDDVEEVSASEAKGTPSPGSPSALAAETKPVTQPTMELFL